MTSNVTPPIAAVEDFASLAAAQMEPDVLAWLSGGSGAEITLRENSAAFDRVQLQARILQSCGEGTLQQTLCGLPLAMPIVPAPIGYLQLLHTNAEAGWMEGAHSIGVPASISSLASTPLAQLAPAVAAGAQPFWFQLYFQPRRETTLQLLRQAEAAGCGLVMVTLDAPVQPLSRRAIRAGFRLPPNYSPPNIPPCEIPRQTLQATDNPVFQGVMAQAPTWGDLRWLRTQTDLPLLAKGVLHADDARRCLDIGLDGLVVSNHGGRALDSSPSTLASLPAIRAAVGAAVPLLLDSGIRNGYDVFKALAQGADAVLSGRALAYALALGGAAGVSHGLRMMRDELSVAMALTGCAILSDIDEHCLFAPR